LSRTPGSFAGLGFLAWYLAGKLKAFDRKGHIAKLCLVFLPLLVASLVAVSRVDDYWHHWQDVFAGGIIGLLVFDALLYLAFRTPFTIKSQSWSVILLFLFRSYSCFILLPAVLPISL
jgi:membrane-associated phospholipid phosphatase